MGDGETVNVAGLRAEGARYVRAELVGEEGVTLTQPFGIRPPVGP